MTAMTELAMTDIAVSTTRPAILIITDSLAFPRALPEHVSYAETYVARLRAAYPDHDIVHYGHGGAPIAKLFSYSTYYHTTLSPILCFIQSGVVDCAPRALTEVELQLITRLPLIGGALGTLVQRNAKILRRVRKLSYTSLEDYRAYVRRFEATFDPVYWITIPPPTAMYESQVPGMSRQAAQYNDVLVQHKHVSTADFTADDMLSDHHHLSGIGHGKIFRRISEIVESTRASG